jgi:hypothetical protein
MAFAGCEHEHWEHHHDAYGTPGPGYEYGTHHEFHHDDDWDGDWRH